MNARGIKEFRAELKNIGTKEIKARALQILHNKGMKNVKLSDFTVREARNLIVEEKFLNK